MERNVISRNDQNKKPKKQLTNIFRQNIHILLIHGTIQKQIKPQNIVLKYVLKVNNC